MDCLIEFCSDFYQKRLRFLAQAQSERYEDTLENYKKMFMAHYQNVMKKCTNGKCPNFETCGYIYKELKKITMKKVEEFFDGLVEIYLCWIDANCIEAIHNFQRLLNLYKLLENSNELEISDIYFKGRVASEVLTCWDMFHIPFNKRYLINNQRYSLTGQPLMYVGSSVLDVAAELENENLSQLKISAIQLPKNIKLYDLRNNIYEQLNNLQAELMLKTTGYSFCATFLYRLILSSICSFQKRQELKGYSFCEEYVLPQILAQIVKNSKFDGIIYYSTKRYDNVAVATDVLSYKENIALFTKADSKHVYDRDLYNKLKISPPIDVNKIEKISTRDIDDVKNEIGKTADQKKIVQAEMLISSFNRVYGELKVGEESYIDTGMGQLHMYHLFAVLNQIMM